MALKRWVKVSLFGFILLILSLVFIQALVRPAILGYAILDQMGSRDTNAQHIVDELEITKTQLEIAHLNLESAERYHNELIQSKADEASKSIQCTFEKDDLEVELNKALSLQRANYTKQISSLEHDIDVLRQEKSSAVSLANDKRTLCEAAQVSLQDKFDSLVKNEAMNKCCKERVDHPEIDSYHVVANSIQCGSGLASSLTC